MVPEGRDPLGKEAVRQAPTLPCHKFGMDRTDRVGLESRRFFLGVES
jgi:hypothetical protein